VLGTDVPEGDHDISPYSEMKVPIHDNLASHPIAQDAWAQWQRITGCGREDVMAISELYVGKDGFRERGDMFGDEGVLYTFVCHTCSVLATKAQGL